MLVQVCEANRSVCMLLLPAGPIGSITVAVVDAGSAQLRRRWPFPWTAPYFADELVMSVAHKTGQRIIRDTIARRTPNVC